MPAQNRCWRNKSSVYATRDAYCVDWNCCGLTRRKKVMQKKRAPGPDGIPGDLFRIMDDESLTIVLQTINKWRKDKAIPKTLSEADVVTIIKKGKSEEPGNYRPRALLQSLYKLHASLLRNRLVGALDSRVSKNSTD